MDDMHPKRYWRQNTWFRRPITLFKLKRKRSDGNYKEDEIDCKVTYSWLDKKYHYYQLKLTPEILISLKKFLHNADKRACGINEIYLFKLIHLNSIICQN